MSALPNIDEQQASQLLEGLSIPPQPVVLTELLKEQKKDEPNLSQIARIISKDLSLSALVLKSINSPVFGLQRECQSINHATMLLGLGNVINITSGAALRMQLGDSNDKALSTFWDMSAETALAASGISRLLNLGEPDEAYTLGLFHNAGIPILMGKFPDYRQRLQAGLQEGTRPLPELEDEQFHTHHAIVGYFLGRNWHLPDQLSEVIREHHNYALLEEGSSPVQDAIAILALASHIIAQYRSNLDWDEWHLAQGPVLDYLHMSESDYEELFADITDMMDESGAN